MIRLVLKYYDRDNEYSYIVKLQDHNPHNSKAFMMFLTYDEKLRDVSLQIESLINQTESNDVADQIDDSSRLLEDRIMQNAKMIGENRAEIYSIAKNQSELVNRVSSIEIIYKNETHLLTESLSQISDKLNKTMIEMQANSTKEFEEISNSIHRPSWNFCLQRLSTG